MQMLTKGRLGRSLYELKVTQSRGSADLQEAESFMRELGLCPFGKHT